MKSNKGKHITISAKANDRQRITNLKNIFEQLDELFATQELVADYSQVDFIESIAKEVRLELNISE